MDQPPAAIHQTIERWHEFLRGRLPGGLDELLHDDVVFYSPVMHTPQRGRAMTAMYLGAALKVFGAGDFRYLREIIGEQDAMLEFQVTLQDIEVNGVDILRWNEDQQIVEFKVMLRPLKAIQLIHQNMGEMLAAAQARTATPG